MPDGCELAEQKEQLTRPRRDPIRIAATRVEEYVRRRLAGCAGEPDQLVLDLERAEMLIAAQIDHVHYLYLSSAQRPR